MVNFFLLLFFAQQCNWLGSLFKMPRTFLLWGSGRWQQKTYFLSKRPLLSCWNWKITTKVPHWNVQPWGWLACFFHLEIGCRRRLKVLRLLVQNHHSLLRVLYLSWRLLRNKILHIKPHLTTIVVEWTLQNVKEQCVVENTEQIKTDQEVRLFVSYWDLQATVFNYLAKIESGLNPRVTYLSGFGRLGERSPEKDCWWWPTFRYPDRKTYLESNDSWKFKRMQWCSGLCCDW